MKAEVYHWIPPYEHKLSPSWKSSTLLLYRHHHQHHHVVLLALISLTCNIEYIYIYIYIYMGPKIYDQDTNTWNRSYTHIGKHEIGSGTKLLFTVEFKVFRNEEKETQFLSMLTFPSDPTTCGTPPQTPGLASASSENQLPSSCFESQQTVFFKFQNPQPIASGHDVIHVPGPISYLGFLLWHLWLSHPPRTRMNTCTQCVYLTNPCTKPKGSQPN